MSANWWSETIVEASGTHHLLGDKPLYSQRFQEVLKYHAPGLAPALDNSGAYHIDRLGEAVYAQRYLRTFGFYQGRAVVQTEDGWFHVLTDGVLLYPERYEWCGNYQMGFCAVRDTDKQYFHLNLSGRPAYTARFIYAGDFRDGVAVVQNNQGLYTHINEKGEPLHSQYYLDLDVYHKGFARAKDKRGWCHADINGLPIYQQRFTMVEPFYNGYARVENANGALAIINETGQVVHQLRQPQQTAFQSVSADMVAYWRSQTIKAAVSLNVFDCLPATIEEVANNIALSASSAQRLLRALEELNLVQRKDDCYFTTERGQFLCSAHALSLREAALYWGSEHYLTWTNLVESLKTEKSVHKSCWNQSLFSWLEQDLQRLTDYQRAIDVYAQHDYAGVAKSVDLTGARSVIDAAGGQGFVLKSLLIEYPHLQGTLLERIKVAELVNVPEALRAQMRVQGFDLFKAWGEKADAIFLTRVLHDWNDEKAMQILRHARDALTDKGTIYLVEMLQIEESPAGALLDLHMLLVSGGKERTWQQYAELAARAGLKLSTETVGVGHNTIMTLTTVD